MVTFDTISVHLLSFNVFINFVFQYHASPFPPDFLFILLIILTDQSSCVAVNISLYRWLQMYRQERLLYDYGMKRSFTMWSNCLSFFVQEIHLAPCIESKTFLISPNELYDYTDVFIWIICQRMHRHTALMDFCHIHYYEYFPMGWNIIEQIFSGISIFIK